MKKKKTHETITRSTYEAAYYTSLGAKLVRVEIVYGNQYQLVLVGVKPYFRQKWYSWFTHVNVRLYVQARLKLKEQIAQMPKGQLSQ